MSNPCLYRPRVVWCIIVAGIAFGGWAAQAQEDARPAAEGSEGYSDEAVATKPMPSVRASVLLLKADWSQAPTAKEIEADVRALLAEASLPERLAQDLPASAPLLLFPDDLTAIYDRPGFEAVLAWLKKHDLIIAPVPEAVIEGEKRFQQIVIGTDRIPFPELPRKENLKVTRSRIEWLCQFSLPQGGPSGLRGFGRRGPPVENGLSVNRSLYEIVSTTYPIQTQLTTQAVYQSTFLFPFQPGQTLVFPWYHHQVEAGLRHWARAQGVDPLLVIEFIEAPGSAPADDDPERVAEAEKAPNAAIAELRSPRAVMPTTPSGGSMSNFALIEGALKKVLARTASESVTDGTSPGTAPGVAPASSRPGVSPGGTRSRNAIPGDPVPAEAEPPLDPGASPGGTRPRDPVPAQAEPSLDPGASPGGTGPRNPVPAQAEPPLDSAALAEVRQRFAEAEQATHKLARLARDAKGGDPEQHARLTDRLKGMVQEAFARRLELQRLEARSLRERVQAIEANLNERQRLEARIVERRIEQLLEDPAQRWDPQMGDSAAADSHRAGMMMSGSPALATRKAQSGADATRRGASSLPPKDAQGRPSPQSESGPAPGNPAAHSATATGDAYIIRTLSKFREAFEHPDLYGPPSRQSALREEYAAQMKLLEIELRAAVEEIGVLQPRLESGSYSNTDAVRLQTDLSRAKARRDRLEVLLDLYRKAAPQEKAADGAAPGASADGAAPGASPAPLPNARRSAVPPGAGPAPGPND